MKEYECVEKGKKICTECRLGVIEESVNGVYCSICNAKFKVVEKQSYEDLF